MVVSLTINFADQVVKVFTDLLSIVFILNLIFLLISLSMFVNVLIGEAILEFHKVAVVCIHWLAISGVEDLVNVNNFRISTLTVDIELISNPFGIIQGFAAVTLSFVVLFNAEDSTILSFIC